MQLTATQTIVLERLNMSPAFTSLHKAASAMWNRGQSYPLTKFNRRKMDKHLASLYDKADADTKRESPATVGIEMVKPDTV